MNAPSIERQRIGRRAKIEKGTREQKKVSGTERKRTDSEEWRQLKISAERSVITDGGRQTASFFFFYSEIKTLINLNRQGCWTSPFPCQTPGRRRCVPPAPCPFITQRKKTPLERGILGNLAWPETRRWRADGGRALCYLLLT